jgi:uncharacterized membrane protein YccC
MLMRTFAPALIGLVIAGCAAAQAPKAEEDHSAHHPAGATAAPAPQAATADRTTASPEGLNRQLKAMQDMHRRMQAAKTPAERAALMDEHMQLMQSGMAMMGQLRGGSMSPGAAMGAGPGMGMHDRMEGRMAMMEQMMQMMVDREAATPRK